MSKLKNIKKIIIGLFIIIFFSLFSYNANCATTIGDTTFPADVGKVYTWKVTYPAEMESYKITFKSESIEKGLHNTIDVLMVNCTIKQYHPLTGWSTTSDNELYLAANNTQNYLYFSDYMFFPNIIPTPINLTLVAEAMYANNYSIVDTTIIEIYNQDTDEYTFNTDGFLTSYISKEDGEMDLKFVLATGDGGAAVPFGNYFLIFMVIGFAALVYLKKQKIK